MEKIKQIILRDTKTGDNLIYSSLENFKEDFKENYDLALKDYCNFCKKDEESFLKALDFNFNAYSTTYFRIVSIRYQANTKKTKTVGNGQGTVYKSNKTGLYIGQYVTGGKRHSVYQKKDEKIGDFKKRFNDILSSIHTGTYIEKSNETFINILTKHIEQKYNDGITSDSSYLRDIYTLNQIKDSCNNFIYKPVQKICVEDIEEAKPNIRKYAQSSIDKIWRLLNKTFNLAISRKKIIFNPMNDETLYKPISEKTPKNIEALTVKEENKLKSILDTELRNHPYRNIAKMQLLTGMRIGEVLARSIENFDNEKNSFLVDNTLTKDKNGNIILGEHTKTYNKRTGVDLGKRILPLDFLDLELKDIILEQMSNRITNIYGLIFWDYEKNTFISYGEINSWLRRLNDKYKITNKSLSTHVLRHTFITRLRESGVDMKIIQYIVGHIEGSSITNDIYTSLSEDFIKQELKKVI